MIKSLWAGVIVILVGLVFATGVMFNEQFSSIPQINAIRTELGKPIHYVQLPNGQYIVVNAVAKSNDMTGTIVVLRMEDGQILLVDKVPVNMVEENQKITVSGTYRTPHKIQ